MKRLLLACLMLFSIAYGQKVETVITVPIVDNGTSEPALLYLPPKYNAKNPVPYPFIVFLHGAGESCPPLSNIYNSSEAGGPAYYIENGGWPDSFVNPLTKIPSQFIVLSPQSNCNEWSTSGLSLETIIAYMVKTYNIDINRIYLTGLSAGGQGIFDYVTGQPGSTCCKTPSPTYEPAAIVPMSMATNGVPNNANVDTTLAHNIWVWGFGSESDVFGIYTHL